MANEEQLSILKQGAETWHAWLDHNMNVKIELSKADLSETDLSGIHLVGANLSRANLSKANLTGTNLRGADLSLAQLGGADLKAAHLERANLRAADLSDTYLVKTALTGADLRQADLSAANLSGAYLHTADFRMILPDMKPEALARLDFAPFQTKLHRTILGNVDLSTTVGLDDVMHYGPSSISTDTFALSKGKIPGLFLKGCGLSDWEIETVKLYNPELSNDERNKILYRIYDLQVSQAIQVSPLFISYSHVNSEFVDKIGNSLTKIGVRYWRDIKDMKSGRMEKQIDNAIRQNPTILLVLSEHSLNSDWVEYEVRTARELGKELGRDTLCPVALDNSWKDSRWPKRIMEQIMEYNILDFSEWQNNNKFDGMFRKLVDGLELFYKG